MEGVRDVRDLKRIVEVEWRDSSSYRGWGSKEEYEKHARGPMVCRTVGYLATKDDNEVFLIMSKAAVNDSVNASMTIPRECVIRIRYLKGGL